ncbi:hypothetical protein BGZ59_011680, partial [Podila verticillata]
QVEQFKSGIDSTSATLRATPDGSLLPRATRRLSLVEVAKFGLMAEPEIGLHFTTIAKCLKDARPYAN